MDSIYMNEIFYYIILIVQNFSSSIFQLSIYVNFLTFYSYNIFRNVHLQHKINKILIYSILDNYYYKCVFKFIIFDILLSILGKNVS